MLLKRDLFERLCRARDLLSTIPEEPQSIEDVARQVAISPFHFIRQFEALFGATPHQYRMSSRLERAKELLAAGEHSVTDVCMEVGFSSLGSFSELFKQRVGTHPSAYQRQRRATIQVPGIVRAALIPGCLGLMSHLPPGAFRSFREA